MFNKVELERNHIMLDLETFDTSPSACVASIGACEFFPSLEGENVIGRKFYVNLEIDTQLKMGRTVSNDTLRWWLSQAPAAQAALCEGGSKLARYGISEFAAWVQDTGCDHIWSHATFDMPIIQSLFEDCNHNQPWHYRAAKDLRTLELCVNGCKIVRTGTHHNALDDAVTQARWCSKMLQKLSGKGVQ